MPIMPFNIFLRTKVYTVPSSDTSYDSSKSGSNSRSELIRKSPEKIRPSTDDDGESVDKIGLSTVGSPPNESEEYAFVVMGMI